MRQLAQIAMASCAMASSAVATDLVNKDGADYVVTVSTGANAVKVALGGKSVKLDVCPSRAARCIVSVAGLGEIEVTGADDVVIRNGRLSKQ